MLLHGEKMQMRDPMLQWVCASANWHLDSLRLNSACPALKSEDSAQKT